MLPHLVPNARRGYFGGTVTHGVEYAQRQLSASLFSRLTVLSFSSPLILMTPKILFLSSPLFNAFGYFSPTSSLPTLMIWSSVSRSWFDQSQRTYVVRLLRETHETKRMIKFPNYKNSVYLETTPEGGESISHSSCVPISPLIQIHYPFLTGFSTDL